ncbi:hypothetical protein BFINE_38960 [Bacteroides finegoldii DSM 17565]|nr:hypothetical protein BFINE_38960 [Bacteroides finegoldii DSM 17565]
MQMVFDEGLYDPANEPDIAYPYLFSYFKGEEWRTQKETQRLLDKYFTTKPDGIPEMMIRERCLHGLFSI